MNKQIKAGTSQGAVEHRRKLFIETYIANGGNGKQAAIKAGFSKKTAESQASRLLRDVKVLGAIENRRSELRKVFSLRTEDVIRNLAQALFFDPRKLFRENGSLKPIHELDEDTVMALASIEIVEIAGAMRERSNGDTQDLPMLNKKVRWYDKNAARDQAMKHLGLFKSHIEVTGSIPMREAPPPDYDKIREIFMKHEARRQQGT